MSSLRLLLIAIAVVAVYAFLEACTEEEVQIGHGPPAGSEVPDCGTPASDDSTSQDADVVDGENPDVEVDGSATDGG